ncbi:triphosphoribosyl-dephospho-CoA synthase, partial [Klebsiella pneumoniae]|uniref:triphosphoribosyl-dephospho-CoA synthase n=1 Tax=Klebsiella pneumoniae TaxID=573 RepID=UPI003968A0EC
AFAPSFTTWAHAGENHQGSPWELFTKIRAIGIHYENTLLRATQQVNTQRGILFSGTVLATAAGCVSGRG